MKARDKLKIIMSNPVLFSSVFCKIVNKQGKLVRFVPNPQQKELLEGMEKYNIVAKSRQLGISVACCLYSLYLCTIESNITCLLLSYSIKSANSIYNKLKMLYDHMEPCIRPVNTVNNRTELVFNNGSRIICGTVGNKDISRGDTVRFVHWSEVAFCKPEQFEKNLIAINNALTEKGQIVLESTSNGLNHWYDMYTQAVNAESLYKPFFFDWIQDKIMFKDEQQQFAKRYKAIHGHALELDELEPLEKSYYERGASLEQLAWRRLKIQNMGRQGEQKFKQEFPSTFLESIINSSKAIYDSEKVEKEYSERKNLPTIKKIINLPPTLQTFLNNYLTVWDLPEVGTRYVIGCDASEGVGEDYTVESVFTTDGLQVAEFRSNKVQPFVCAEVLYNLARYYNNALCVVEKASGGHLILDKLRNEYHYLNIYKHKEYDSHGKCIKKIGFNTTPKTKGALIQNGNEMFSNDDVYIKSLALLNEMKTYYYSDGKMNAEQGEHDDCCLAYSLATEGIRSGIFYM